jgi:hypothetical protein
MESSVARRETIVTRGEFQQKLPQNKAIMQSTIQKKIIDTQKQIRESTQVSFKIINTCQGKARQDFFMSYFEANTVLVEIRNRRFWVSTSLNNQVRIPKSYINWIHVYRNVLGGNWQF